MMPSLPKASTLHAMPSLDPRAEMFAVVRVGEGRKEEGEGRMFIRSYLVRADAYLSFLRRCQHTECERKDILLPLCP